MKEYRCRKCEYRFWAYYVHSLQWSIKKIEPMKILEQYLVSFKYMDEVLKNPIGAVKRMKKLVGY